MTPRPTIDLQRCGYPFPHAVGTEVLDSELATRLHRAVSSVEKWERTTGEFYRNAKIAFTSDAIPPELGGLLTAELTDSVRKAVEASFGVVLRERAEMMLNRFVAGDGTMVHNDYMPDPGMPYYFTHRALLYLNPGWVRSNGGLLGIFDAPDATMPVSVIEPRHNTMSAMAMGPRSFHAVSAQRGPERYSVVWSFCTEDGSHQT